MVQMAFLFALITQVRKGPLVVMEQFGTLPGLFDALQQPLAMSEYVAVLKITFS